jgi:hypothetical protein
LCQARKPVEEPEHAGPAAVVEGGPGLVDLWESSPIRPGDGNQAEEIIDVIFPEKMARQESLQEKLEPPRIIVEDVTQEELGRMLCRNNEQLFSLSADAGKNLQNLEGRYNKDKDESDDDIQCEVLYRGLVQSKAQKSAPQAVVQYESPDETKSAL